MRLLALGRLPYERYEAWRRGELAALEDALRGNRERVVEQLAAAADWVQRLRLTPSEVHWDAWGGAGRLRLFRDEAADRLARTHYGKPEGDAGQLDLFLDNAASLLLDGLRDALAARRADDARRHLRDLLRHAPRHRLRPAAEALCDALPYLERPVTDPARELAAVADHLALHARELLGARARDFLAPFWRRLAAAVPVVFAPPQERLHRSWVCAQYLDWPAVVEGVRATPEFERHPTLLRRLARAHWLLGQEGEATAVACRLCWLHPNQAEDWLGGSEPAAELRERWERLQDLPEPLAADWLPAWLLIDDPGLARVLPEGLGIGAGAPGSAFALLQRLRRGDGESAGLRAELKALNPVLFAAYMRRVG